MIQLPSHCGCSLDTAHLYREKKQNLAVAIAFILEKQPISKRK